MVDHIYVFARLDVSVPDINSSNVRATVANLNMDQYFKRGKYGLFLSKSAEQGDDVDQASPSEGKIILYWF